MRLFVTTREFEPCKEHYMRTRFDCIARGLFFLTAFLATSMSAPGTSVGQEMEFRGPYDRLAESLMEELRTGRPSVENIRERWPVSTGGIDGTSEQLLNSAAMDTNVAVRSGAAEALGYLRAYTAEYSLIAALDSPHPVVRQEAATALAWCGGRESVSPLISTLDDEEWIVRAAAWASLTNVTGNLFPFDARAKQDERMRQAGAWREWWIDVEADATPVDGLALTRCEDLSAKLRGARALGALSGADSAPDVTETLMVIVDKYADQGNTTITRIESHLMQAAIQSLGRLKNPHSLPTMLALLEKESWARYAAMALGEFGSPEAVKPLIRAYPRYARDLSNRRGKGNLHNPALCPIDDRYSGDNTQDRMHETPYCILYALCRLRIESPRDRGLLRDITPHILANLPSDWDGGVLYEPESYQRLTYHLLEISGVRSAACEAAFEAVERITSQEECLNWLRKTPDEFASENYGPTGLSQEVWFDILANRVYGDVPYVSPWFPTLCDSTDIPRLIALLEHPSGWISINATKALMFLDAKEAIAPIAALLEAIPQEATWGFSGVLEHAEYDDPTPRRQEAFIRAIGRLGANEHQDLLIRIMEDPLRVVDIRHAAALALDELGTPATIEALRLAEQEHPFYSVRLAAREALWRRGVEPFPRIEINRPFPYEAVNDSFAPEMMRTEVDAAGLPLNYVFIQGDPEIGSDFNGQAGVDPWRQTYSITNSGPAYRRGRNLFLLNLSEEPNGRPTVRPLTQFTDGYVADCEVSWDGRRIIFARRLDGDSRNYSQVDHEEPRQTFSEQLLGSSQDPWWHLWEINIDGSGLRQLTFGPYHDVGPAYMPDNRIVFTTTRLGLRDEYHGYPCTGLALFDPNAWVEGKPFDAETFSPIEEAAARGYRIEDPRIQIIGFNLGGDREPAVLNDGRLIFTRLDNFYSRLKTEMTIQTAFPDGTRNFGYYGPERREFWRTVHETNAAWAMRESYANNPDNRNRVLRLTQPQPMSDGRVVCVTSGGLALVDPQRYSETLVPHDRSMAVTSPFPLGDGRHVVCAATRKQFQIEDEIITGGSDRFAELTKGPALFRAATNIDLGLYLLNIETGVMRLLFNDSAHAEFEARPLVARERPPILSPNSNVASEDYTAQLFCSSVYQSRETRTAERGRWIRVIEGMPVVSRHESQNNLPTNRWKNHGGTHARVLGTVPLASDGSFHLEAPADRLLQLQVLDADRRVINNQTFWMYARPGERRSCTGCHENPTTRTASVNFPTTGFYEPVPVLPYGGEFTYRAKAWLKGAIPDECEERNRSVRSVNLIACP
jgi:HEAT repeat protein